MKIKLFTYMLLLFGISVALHTHDLAAASGTGPCGCSCEPDCSCGCRETGVCTCDQDGCDQIALPNWNGNDWCGACDYQTAYPRRSHVPCMDQMRIRQRNETDCEHARLCGLCGVWLPECPVLFRPFIADPRQVCYGAAWRFNDKVFPQNTIPVSFGDTLAIYRWCNIWGGQLQIELEGCLWAIFDPLHDSSPLINADYYCAVPITYAKGPWALRLRGFHISSHIGDEFLLNHPHFRRRNPSAEYLDFSVSYDLTDEIRYYALVGWVVAQDSSFRLGKLYLQAGAEVRLSRYGFVGWCNQIYGEPFFAVHWNWNSRYNRHVDLTYALGYEFGKLCGLCRKVRFWMEYHDGYSVEGQFQRFPTHYFALRMCYGY